MTRAEALALLQGPADIDWDELDEIFRVFGIVSRTPNFVTEVYYHPEYRGLGIFTAHDDGIHTVPPYRKREALWLIMRIIATETGG